MTPKHVFSKNSSLYMHKPSAGVRVSLWCQGVESTRDPCVFYFRGESLHVFYTAFSDKRRWPE